MNAYSVDSTSNGVDAASWIPLDLAPALTPHAHHKQLAIRLEGLPQGATLSKGQNNGDRTWTLRPDELADLAYLPPAAACAPHVLHVRVFGTDGEEMVALALYELPITPVAPPPAQPGSDGGAAQTQEQAAQADAAALQQQTAALTQQLAAAEARAAAAENAVAQTSAQLAEAMARVQAAETESRAVAERFHQSHDADLARARAEWEDEFAAAQAEAAIQYQVRLDEAREQWESETEAKIAQVRMAVQGAGQKKPAVAKSSRADKKARRASYRPSVGRSVAYRARQATRGFARAGLVAAFLAVCVSVYPKVEPKLMAMWGPEITEIKVKLASFRD